MGYGDLVNELMNEWEATGKREAYVLRLKLLGIQRVYQKVTIIKDHYAPLIFVRKYIFFEKYCPNKIF